MTVPLQPPPTQILSALTPLQVDLFQQLVDDYRKRTGQGGAAGGGSSVRNLKGDDSPWALHYMVRTPNAGIPALGEGLLTGTGTGLIPLDDVPGAASCDVYRQIREGVNRAIISCGFSVIVYNWNNVVIPGNNWVSIHKDGWGYWNVPVIGFDFTTC